MRLVIDSSSYWYVEAVFAGHIFGIYQDESTREVCGIFRGGAFYDYHIIQLWTGDDVEWKGAWIGFRTGHGTPVHPYIIVPLRQAAHHYKLFVDDADAGYATDDFRGIAVLGFSYLLGGNPALYYEAAALFLYECHLVIPFGLCSDGDFA